MVNYFEGWSEDQLLAALEEVRKDIAKGRTLIQWGAGDSSGMSKITTTPEQRYRYIWFALSQLNSTVYPPALGARVRNTTPRFF